MEACEGGEGLKNHLCLSTLSPNQPRSLRASGGTQGAVHPLPGPGGVLPVMQKESSSHVGSMMVAQQKPLELTAFWTAESSVLTSFLLSSLSYPNWQIFLSKY